MKRRELIKLVTLATGSVLSVPLMNSLLIGCESATKVEDVDYTLQFFNKDEFTFVRKIIDVILPRTDSPSATDVGVHTTIDTMLAKVYEPKQKTIYKTQFSELLSFVNKSDKTMTEVLMELLMSEDNTRARKGLVELKQQTIAYYYSTEEISKNHLNYIPVPGKYEPCISLEEVNGKAWAI